MNNFSLSAAEYYYAIFFPYIQDIILCQLLFFRLCLTLKGISAFGSIFC